MTNYDFNTEEKGEVTNGLQEVVVSISDPTRVSVAGLVFANPDKPKVVNYNERVKEAVENNHLKLHTNV